MCERAKFHKNQIENASIAAKAIVGDDPKTLALIDIMTKSNTGIVELCGSILDKNAEQDKEILGVKNTVNNLCEETWLQKNWKLTAGGFAVMVIAVCFFGISYLEVKYGKPAVTANNVVEHYINAKK